MGFRRIMAALAAALALLPLIAAGGAAPAAAAGECASGYQYFEQTKKCVGPAFYAYWQSHGGLAQQGLPITDDFPEISAADGKVYQVQYFERARFELHPEQADPQYRVLLGLLGNEQYRAKYPNGSPARAGNCAAGERFFAETNHCVSALFAAYWASHGGLAQQGYPISDEFEEVNPSNQQKYRVQYFERARFEAHPENQAPFDVLLGLLGGEQVRAKYPDTIPVGQDSLAGPTGVFDPSSSANTVVEYAGGGLHFGVKVPNWYVWVGNSYIDPNPAAAVNTIGQNNLRVEVDAARTAGADDSYFGVMCRYSYTDDQHYRWYEFLIGPDGYYAINKVTGPGEQDFVHLAGAGDARSPAIKQGNATNHLRADCKGDTLTLTVNGQQVAQAQDTALTGDGFGLEVGTDKGGPVDVAMKNLVVGILP